MSQYPPAPPPPPGPPGGYGYGYGEVPPFGPAPQLAEMGQRLLARLLDWAIWLGVAVIAWIVEALFRAVHLGALASLLSLVFVLAALAYEPFLVATRGATIGKQVLGIKVINAGTGEVPGWGPSLLRWGIQVIGVILCCIGLLLVWASPLFDNTGRRQGWHDKAAGTLVVKA